MLLSASEAGPGSIAESMIKGKRVGCVVEHAMSLVKAEDLRPMRPRGLPCLLTAFVPGQEEGNISYAGPAH